ncbi:MAG: helix-turn-helix domain-containing protein [Candidatus Giovannonibacteria bacterium]|nr:MAG: helix-turn-helix domain-containing protein [Candidatus Giovannonibacteria bacterium]
MAKIKERQKALRLRKLGQSYAQIKKVLGVSKSTLSYWLRNHPLSVKRIRELRDWNQARIEHYIETRRRKRENILREIYIKEKNIILPLSQQEIFIGGLFLYLGEGGKTKEYELSLSNTDPAILKIFIHWLTKILNVPKNKLRIKLHLYEDMNVRGEIKFWSEELKIPFSQFTKPYIKKTKRSSLTYKGGFGHGTCNVIIGDAKLAKRIFMGLEVIRDYFSKRASSLAV